MSFLLLISFSLLLIALLFLWLGRAAHIQTGLPEGEVIYSDTGAWQKADKPLISRRYGLVGKPDYLVQVQEKGRQITIPIEVKSRKRPKVAYDSHLLQLATYCLLVEETTGQRPTYGLLRYADDTLKIPFTDTLRAQVIETAGAIRKARRSTNVQRQHAMPSRCVGCGYRDGCGSESLAG